MKKFKYFTVVEYLVALSRREPVPGGGSAAAFSGALGAGLLCMVANYSVGKNADQRVDGKIKKILKQAEHIRDRFLDLVDEDAQAYLGIVAARKGPIKRQKAADCAARKVSWETCRLAYRAVNLASYLATHGSKYLLSDVEVAVELLVAAFNGAMALRK